MKISYAMAAGLLLALSGHAQEALLWKDFVSARKEGRTPVLPDYSYAGYHFSGKEIPDVNKRKQFSVKDYGALPNDTAFDDAGIQAAILAAEANAGGGVVFFPPGIYLISPDENKNKRIVISNSNIVLKGSGSGAGGTEILSVKMRIGARQFYFGPKENKTAKLAVVSEAAPREGFWVTVRDASKLKAGQNVTLRHKSEAYTRAYFAPQELKTDWTRLFGDKGGMNIAEIHTIAEVKGNKVRFENPLHVDVKLIPQYDWTLESFNSLQECGIEDIRFTGRWDSYPEEFVHHKDGIHDGGWCAVSMEYLENSWIRNCVFNNWNEGVFLRAGYRVSILNTVFGGKGGHSTVHARAGYGVLVKQCKFESSHHGPGTGYGGVNTVVTQCEMAVDQNIDSHSGQPYASLFDDVQGGVFRNIGGPHPGFPHHGKYLVFWNFEHRSTWDFTYNFWDMEKRKNHTFAQPVFVGFRANKDIKFVNAGMNELPGVKVQPESLFEAQLALRLKGDK